MRYVAFLRAINVGKRRVKMDKLKSVVSSLPIHQIDTFIASGNLLFESESLDKGTLESDLEICLEDGLGFFSEVYLRSMGELAEIVNHTPFNDLDTIEKPAALNVVFLKAEPDSKTREKIASLALEGNDFSVHGAHIYWYSPTQISASPVGRKFTQIVKKLGTMRNVATMERLLKTKG